MVEGPDELFRALEGIRVLELTSAIAGPQCGQILADYGAEVIKIEPLQGERTRNSDPRFDDDSLYFAAQNRAKKSVAIDLKSEDGIKIVWRLCAESDVLITNFSKSVPRRLGFGYDTLSALNPRIIMAHISGFGSQPSDADRPAFDGVIQALSGVADRTGSTESGPMLPGAMLADHVVSYQTTLGILLRLWAREATGLGSFLDVSMLESYMAVLAYELGEAAEGVRHVRQSSRVPIRLAGLFPAADGHVFIQIVGPAHWPVFCDSIGRPDLPSALSYDDAVFSRREEADAIVAAWTSCRSRSDIDTVLSAAGVVVGPVRTVAEAVEAARRSPRRPLATVEGANGRPFTVAGRLVASIQAQPPLQRAPRLSEHTRDVLTDLGYSADELHDLERRGVIGPIS